MAQLTKKSFLIRLAKEQTKSNFIDLKDTYKGYTKDKKLIKDIKRYGKGKFLKRELKSYNEYVEIFRKSDINAKEKGDEIKQGTLFQNSIFFTVLSHSSKQVRILEERLTFFKNNGYDVFVNFKPLKRIVSTFTDISIALLDLWELCEKIQIGLDDSQDSKFGKESRDYPTLTAIFQENITKKTYKVLVTIP